MASESKTTEELAHEAWETGRLKQAMRLFRRGANDGLHGCMLNLGFFYDTGIAGRADKAKAMFWYKRAYRKGDAAAASNIALLYKEKSKNRLMLRWFKKSFEMGDGDSALELAKLYIDGVGVRPSRDSAKRYLLSASNSKCITPGSKEEAQIFLQHFPLSM